MAIKHTKTAIPDVDKVDCIDWNADHTVDNQHIIPVGSLFMYGAAAAPTGWLLCNGAAVNRITYAALFVVIGTTYGIGDGSTTFNVPNFASKFPRGNTPGATGGSDDAVVVSHDHGGATGNQSASHTHSHTHGAIASGIQSASHQHDTVMGSHNHLVFLYDTSGSIFNFAGGIGGSFGEATTRSTNLGTKTSGIQSASHTHSTTIPAKTSGNQSADHNHTINSDGVVGTNENIPAYLGANFIIKY